MCLLRALLWANNLSQNLHTYGFSLVWHLMCVLMWLFWANNLSHKWHLYGLSPVWVLMCTVSVPWVNDLQHNWQLYNFTPLWVLMCLIWFLPWAKMTSDTTDICVSYLQYRLSCALSRDYMYFEQMVSDLPGSCMVFHVYFFPQKLQNSNWYNWQPCD